MRFRVFAAAALVILFAAVQCVYPADESSIFGEQEQPKTAGEKLDDIYHGVKDNFPQPKDSSSSAAERFSGRYVPDDDILDVLNKPGLITPPEPKGRKAEPIEWEPVSKSTREVQSLVAACGAWAVALVGMAIRRK